MEQRTPAKSGIARFLETYVTYRLLWFVSPFVVALGLLASGTTAGCAVGAPLLVLWGFWVVRSRSRFERQATGATSSF